MAITDDQILREARVAFGELPGSSFKPPASFLKQLKEYRSQVPDEASFTFQYHKNGSGAVTCNECGETFELEAIRFRPDGSREDGVGSFTSIRHHNKTSKHKCARNERLQREKSGIKQEPHGPLGDKPFNHRALSERESQNDLLRPVSPTRVPIKPTFAVKEDDDDNDDQMRVDAKPRIQLEPQDDVKPKWPFIDVDGLSDAVEEKPKIIKKAHVVENGPVGGPSRALPAQAAIPMPARPPLPPAPMYRPSSWATALENDSGVLEDAAMMLAAPKMASRFPGFESEDEDDEEPLVFHPPESAPSYIPVPYAARYSEHSSFLKDCIDVSELDGNATVEDAKKELGIPLKGAARFEGMARDLALLPHQVIGVSWMKKQEEGKLQGGILADEMGLGKTVQMICAMLLNEPDTREKTTLIIAPLALLEQWSDEIKDKTEDRWSICIYHGPGKPKRSKEIANHDIVLTTYGTAALEWQPDDELEIKRMKRKERKQGFVVDDSNRGAKPHGPLYRVNFHRIVLDEAHNCRNKNTRTSRALVNLKATYRWALTGTPIANTLSDAFGLFRFLRVRPYDDFSQFSSHIGRLEKRRTAQAAQRLQVIFKRCLLRRKKDSLLDGKPLITLPEKHIYMEELVFSVDEREIYDAVEKKAQQTVNRFIRQGSAMKNYTTILALLLRLRQLCSHPALICEDSFREAFEVPEEHANLERAKAVLARAKNLVGQAFVDKTKNALREACLARMAAEKEGTAMPDGQECPICLSGDVGIESKGSILPCSHQFCTDCLVEVLDAPGGADNGDEDTPRMCADQRPCPTCRQPFSRETMFDLEAFEPSNADLGIVESDEEEAEPKVSPGDDGGEIKPMVSEDHVSETEDERPFKRQRVIEISSDDESEEESGPLHRKERISYKVTKKAVIADSDEEYEVDEEADDFVVDDDVDEDDLSDYTPKMKRKRAKGKAKRTHQTSSDEEDETFVAKKPKKSNHMWKKASMLEGLPPFAHIKASCKMVRMLELVNEGLIAGDKIILVSQWVSALDLFAAYLEEYDILYERYQGGMSRAERGKALRQFQREKQINVLLLSLKTGGVGLNLVASNRMFSPSNSGDLHLLDSAGVISMDLHWSPATEKQAFDRVHRLGQQKEVHINRLVVENTVEARILEKQKFKNLLSDEALGEGVGKKLTKLTVQDIADLFGIGA